MKYQILFVGKNKRKYNCQMLNMPIEGVGGGGGGRVGGGRVGGGGYKLSIQKTDAANRVIPDQI